VIYLATINTLNTRHSKNSSKTQVEARRTECKVFGQIMDVRTVCESIMKDKARTQARDNLNGATLVKYMGNLLGSIRMQKLMTT